MEATAKLVVHSAGGHGAQRVQRHLERFIASGAHVVAKQKVERHGAGKLGSIAKSAVRGVEGAAKILESGIERGLVGDAAGGGGVGHPLKLRDDISAGLNNLRALFAPSRRETLEQYRKSGTTVAIVRRKVSASEERL